MKNIAILGSTGSIGISALEVIRHFPGYFKVVALSANSNVSLLEKQIKEFRPEFACVAETKAAVSLNCGRTKLLTGKAGLDELAQLAKIDEILLAISGSSALAPLLKAVEAGKHIALANKEALVMAGPLIMEEAAKRKAQIIPVDSEQSAIWQCLEGRRQEDLNSIYLTASGGPFRKASKKELKGVSVTKVLRHPRWKMGKKITVDSATLMNKGLELLEAMFLFNAPSKKIKVLIHPEAIIHSMVEFVDGVVLAQLSATDMRIPIQYALSYPVRLSNSLPTVDFYRLNKLTFEPPDFKKFPCLGLAYRAAEELGTSPCALNAANEICVREFLAENIGFTDIPEIISRVLDRHRNNKRPGLTDILDCDSWARQEAVNIIGEFN